MSIADMKPIALMAVLLLLAGCESDSQSDYALYYQVLRQSLASGVGSNTHVTREQAASIPYASIGYRLNDGPEQLLVLATDTGGEQIWTAGSHIVIVTRGGQIVRTVGFAQDVSSVTPQNGQRPFTPTAAASAGTITTVRLEDFPSIPVYGAAVTCTAIPKGFETVVILGRGIATRKVDQACHSDILDWSFTDSYWIDRQSALVWRSIQHISPKDGKIEIETLRPPA